MNYQRDYILRMIHMLGELMREVARMMDDQDRMRLLNSACREHCGMPLTTIEALSVESLLTLLPSVPRLIAGELLAGKAETCRLPIGEAEQLQYKALRLLASLNEETQWCDLLTQKLQTLKQAVFPLLTAQDLMDCARFFAQAEQYDEMEDALFQGMALASGEARETCRSQGIAMLRRAAGATERTLILCRMTAAELRLSARELEAFPNPYERENPV
ncbi:MAG: hypothetical protein LLF96_04585 [Eubacteriales bacterium]|nr:hypothetical protein [Eubacteriales bacterium]